MLCLFGAAAAQDISIKGTLTDSLSFIPAPNVKVTLKKGRDNTTIHNTNRHQREIFILKI